MQHIKGVIFMDFIKKHIFELVEFKKDIDITYEEYNGVKVTYDGTKAVIGYNSKSNLARGYFLLAMNISKEDKPFTICQKRHFETLGTSLDVSRGGAPTVDAIKHYIVYLAALGFNRFGMYMEDMYEMPKYPRFGYMRGRYTQAELKEIDNFAYSFGIEMSGGIRALGHMEQYLQWQEADPIRNTPNILLVDNEKTYEFLEDCIRFMSETFHSKTISLGMDEAASLHLGKYMKLHGLQDGLQVYFRHMHRVLDLCKKYGLKPAMSVDTIFRLASKTGAYYDLDIKFDDELKAMIPEGVFTSAWTYGVPREVDLEKYGLDTEGYYRVFLGKHKDLNPDFRFATAIWCWEGFFEDTAYTIESSVPAMINAVKQEFKHVNVTTWGDQGAETNIIKQIPSTLPIYSEYCFRGLDCTMDNIIEVSSYLVKMPYQNKIELMRRIHGGFWDCQKFHKSLVYSDIFYNLIDLEYDYNKISTMYKEGIELCNKYISEDSRNEDYYSFCLLGFNIGILKLDLFENLRKKYYEKDMDYLKKAAYEIIPYIIKYTNEFYESFQKNWDETNKPFGSENSQIRLGGVVRRAEYVAKRIEKYINGEIERIEELEQEVLLSPRITYNHGFRKNTTANIAGIV